MFEKCRLRSSFPGMRHGFGGRFPALGSGFLGRRAVPLGGLVVALAGGAYENQAGHALGMIDGGLHGHDTAAGVPESS